MTTLLAARAAKYERTLRRLRPACFEYDDAKLEKAHRLIGRMCRLIALHHQSTRRIDQWGATAEDRRLLARHGVCWGD